MAGFVGWIDDAREAFALLEPESSSCVRRRSSCRCRRRTRCCSDGPLAGAHVDDVRVVWLHGDRADRQRVPALEDRVEGDAAVGRLVEAGRRRPDVKHVGTAWDAGQVGDPAGEHRGTDGAPGEVKRDRWWAGGRLRRQGSDSGEHDRKSSNGLDSHALTLTRSGAYGRITASDWPRA